LLRSLPSLGPTNELAAGLPPHHFSRHSASLQIDANLVGAA
jgi:hypothetical protein